MHIGEFEELYFKTKAIQASLKTIQKPSSIAKISKEFSENMAKGNISSTLYLLTNNVENGVLALNKDILAKLQKHPNGKMASQVVLLNGPLHNIHHITFKSVNEEMIRKAAIRNKGG